MIAPVDETKSTLQDALGEVDTDGVDEAANDQCADGMQEVFIALYQILRISFLTIFCRMSFSEFLRKLKSHFLINYQIQIQIIG